MTIEQKYQKLCEEILTLQGERSRHKAKNIMRLRLNEFRYALLGHIERQRKLSNSEEKNTIKYLGAMSKGAPHKEVKSMLNPNS